ncbi:transcriptional regulator [Pseudonocardia sediminis]|uniref:Transcriptional regulator n=1 Tax=Pseudonocardia sediminis TaxID=1397368 RepID=A0A4Q7UTH5_PSEST|nr:transcriptional regulator [Pseudonocardia sediminis]
MRGYGVRVVAITVFGATRATVGGVPVDLGGPRQRAVLGLLVAARGRVVSTDRFRHDLWAGEPPPKALGALQAYVSHLRRLLEPERPPRTPATVLVSTAPGYQLVLPEDAVDAWRFAASVHAAGAGGDPSRVRQQAAEALALWTGEPFAGHADAEWATTEAARLRGLRSDAVELRAGAELDLGTSDGETLSTLGDLVREEPLREHAVALYATTLYRAGRQGEALAVLRAARARLSDELGVDPGPELRELEHDVLNQAAHLDRPRSRPLTRTGSRDDGGPDGGAADGGAAGSTGVHRPPDLLGRDAELRRLHAALDAVSGVPSLVWVEGEAGAGKSTLLDRFAADVGAAGTATLARGRCSEVDGAPPGWAWHDVVTALTGREPGTGTAYALTRALGDALAATTGPVVVLIEDAHRADQETLQVLRHLVTGTGTGTGTAPLVVASFRPDETGPDLATAVAATAQHTADRIRLRGLDDDAAREILRRHVGRELPEEQWRRLTGRAAGNPLFLRQLGALVASEGADAGATGLPVALRDLLGRRLDRLPPRTAHTLSRASVLGRDVDVDLLLAVEALRGALDEDDLVDDLDTGVVAGLLEVGGPGALRFTHVLVRDACYDRLPPMRRERLHRAVLDVLEVRHPDRVSALAHHADGALGPSTAERAAAHLAVGARAAQAAGALSDAARWWRAVLRAHDLGAGGTRGRLEAHRELVRTIAAGGDHRAAGIEQAASVEAAERIGTVRDVALASLWDTPALWSSRPFGATGTAERITGLLGRIDPGDDALRAGLLVSLAHEVEPWGVTAGRDAADTALALAATVGEPGLLCRALNVAFLQTFQTIDVGYCARIGTETLRVASDAGLLEHQALAHLMLLSDSVGRADTAAARAHLDAAVRAGTTGQLPSLLLAASIYEATAALLGGDLDRAGAEFDAAFARIAAAGDPNADLIRPWLRFTVRHAAGDRADMVTELDELRRGLPPGPVDDMLVSALLDAGEESRARALWPPPEWPRNSTWLVATALRADNAVRLGDTDEARRAHDALVPWSGWLARTLNGFLVLGPVDRYLARTATLLGDPAAEAYRASADATVTALRT